MCWFEGKEMNTRKNKSFVLTAISAAILQFSGVAYASDSSKSEADTDTEVITVTASRRVQVLQDVPAAVVAVDPEEFANAGLTEVSDLVEYTPGFSMTKSAGQRGKGAITARGVSQLGNTAVVAVYVDDVPMTSNSGFANGGGLFFDGLLGDIERVEMIKGPQGTLFGATSVGGAMRYITRKPSTDEVRGNISVNLSDTHEGGFNQTYSGYVSFPLINDELGVTISGFSEDNDGFIDRINPGTGEISVENADASDNKGGSIDLLYTPTDDLEIRLRGLQQKSEYSGTSLVRIFGEDKQPVFGDYIGDDQLSSNSYENTLVSGNLDYYFEEVTLTATSSYVKYETESVVDFTAAYSGLADLLQGNPAGTTTSVPFSALVSSEKHVHEVRLTSDNSDTFEWLAGLYYADESTTADQLGVAQPGDFLAFQVSFPSEYEEKAIFVNGTYYLTENFDITAGMRFADTSMSLDYITDGPLAGGSSNESLPDADATIRTYLLAARYRVDEDMSLYARIASGYRPASSNLRISNPLTGETLTQPLVEQDDLWSYEIGAKGNIKDGFLQYDISIWTLDWDQFQAPIRAFGLNSLANAEDGITASGFEASFDMDFDNGFTLITSLAYSDSTLNSDEPSLNGLKGAYVPDVPKWTVSSRANYSYELSDSIMGNVSGGFRYTDGFSTAFTNGDPSNVAVDIESDDYIIADISAGLTMDNISINLYVTNLFNEKAFANVGASKIPTANGVFIDANAVPIVPRTIGAMLSYSF